MSNLPESPATPDPAKCAGCNGHGMVGNILDSDVCPFCHGSGTESERATPGASDTETAELRALCEAALPDNHGGKRDEFRATFTPARVLKLVEVIEKFEQLFCSDRARIAQSAPAGWKLMPPEITDDMYDAGNDASDCDAEADEDLGARANLNNIGEVYAALFAAAPTPPAQPAPTATWHCDTHGEWDSTASGCPHCVREMRGQIKVLRGALDRILENDSMDQSPWRTAREALKAADNLPAPDLSTPSMRGDGVSARDADAERYRYMMDWQDGSDPQPEAIMDMWRKVMADNRLKPTRAEYEAAIDSAIRTLKTAPAAPSDARDAQGEAS